MTKRFPPEFLEAWRSGQAKAAFVSDEPPIRPGRDCDNCGGRGFMSTFLAKNGPYNSPSNGKDDVNHYHDGKWWVGKTITATCPVCKGLNAQPVIVEEQQVERGYSRPKQMADVLARKDWD